MALANIRPAATPTESTTLARRAIEEEPWLPKKTLSLNTSGIKQVTYETGAGD